MPRSLPHRPSFEYIRKEAKDLLAAHQGGDVSVCDTLHLHNRFQGASDAAIVATRVSLQEVQHALALAYGFKSWSEMKAFVESLPTMKSVGLPLSEHGSLSRWWVSDPENFEVHGDTWIFSGKDVRLEVGEMSWDNYVLSIEVWINRSRPDGRYCVQLTGRGTTIYCQLLPGCVRIAYYCDEPAAAAKGFTHLALREIDVAERTWLSFDMEAKAGAVAAFLGGQKIASASIPCGTRGMPGLLVNLQKDAEVRVRNLRVKFLKPAPGQFSEYGTDALTNWERYVEVHGDTLPDERPADA